MGKVSVWVGYVVATTALLYTEYYAALLPFSHGVWALWAFRRELRRLLPLIAGWVAVALLYLPWLLYAVPELIPYVSQKIVEDADKPLGLLAYAARHTLAFTSGHIPPQLIWQELLRWLALVAFLAICVAPFLRVLSHRRIPVPSPRSPIPNPHSPVPSPRSPIPNPHSPVPSPRSPLPTPHSPIPFLSLLLLLSTAIGYLLNLRLPFFPQGGERVLLFVLPYFLMLASMATDQLLATGGRWVRIAVTLGATGLLAGAATGVWAFYTTPRYEQDDYRPLIRQTVQQGSDTDTVLAVFPWQVGYWRAYAPVWGRGELHGPWPLLTPSTAWDGSAQAAIDTALEQGKLWFPAHLSLGGILEGAIEEYLRTEIPSRPEQAVVNFENRWYNPSTRLSGWVRTSKALDVEIAVDFSAVQLYWAGAAPYRTISGNEVAAVVLGWVNVRSQELRATLRLEDDNQRVWAQRDYAPVGSWPAIGVPGGMDQVGLLIPSGVPPGRYRVVVGVGPAEADWLYTARTPAGFSDMAEIGALLIAAPEESLPSLRLPIQIALDEPVTREGIDFLGLSGIDPAVTTLAGAQMNLSLFVQSGQPVSRPWELYVSLLDGNGAGVAGWEGWPLPDHPLQSWPPGTQMRLPVTFFLPATLAPGEYRLVAGLRDPASGEKSPPVELGGLPVERRAANFTSPQPQFLLNQPALFGSHAILLGYDVVRTAGETIDITLYWQVEQTLLPPHNVFVHLRDGAGTLLAQDDGVPGRKQTAAPSNTWMAGEFISDPHTLPAISPQGLVAEVGLYEPLSGVRLPVNVNDEIVGDTYRIDLDVP